VAGSGECGDELPGSGATELVFRTILTVTSDYFLEQY
jgi:hypothetical protein